MRIKIGTVMEEKILYEAKKAALEKNKKLNRIFEEALEEFLKNRKRERMKKGIARRTQGLIKLPSDKLREVMDEPGIIEP